MQGNAVAVTDLTYHYAPGETVTVPLFGDTVAHPVPGEITEVVNDTLDYFGVPSRSSTATSCTASHALRHRP